jgi:hypothetical protein
MSRRAPNAFLLAGLALLTGALPLAARAQTYDVELKTTLNDLPVKVETVPMSGVLVVRLTNTGSVKVRCELRYDASPQPMGRAYVYVEPGRTEEDSFRAKRNWFDVEVEVTCKAADES